MNSFIKKMHRTVLFLAAFISNAALGHTFAPAGGDVPPQNINGPVGMSADGSVGVGTMLCPTLSSGTPYRCVNSYWLNESGTSTVIDFDAETALSLAANQSIPEILAVSTSHDAESITGTYTIETTLSNSPPRVIKTSKPVAFHWSEQTGFRSIGTPDNPNQQFYTGSFSSLPKAISADGSTVVGIAVEHLYDYSISAWVWKYEAFSWTESTGLVKLTSIPWSTETGAELISADGQVAVGYAKYANSNRLTVRWSPQGPLSIGQLDGGTNTATARAMTPDASVVVGQSSSALGQEAFRWTAAQGTVGLGLPAGSGWIGSDATAVSANGNVVVGYASNSSNVTQAFRWTAEDGMTGLGYLPGGTYSKALYVSSDGNLIVGTSNRTASAQCLQDHSASFINLCGLDYFVWSPATGMQSLRDLLDQHGYDMTGWEMQGFDSSLVVSPDASTLWISAFHTHTFLTSQPVYPYSNESGYYRSFVVHLDRILADIDIDPWSGANQVAPNNPSGKISVALLGRNAAMGDSSNFDVTTLNPATLRFGYTEASPVAGPLAADFNGDSKPDVAYLFNTADTGIVCGDTEATLVGETYSGDRFTASDSFTTVDCSTNTCHP